MLYAGQIRSEFSGYRFGENVFLRAGLVNPLQLEFVKGLRYLEKVFEKKNFPSIKYKNKNLMEDKKKTINTLV